MVVDGVREVLRVDSATITAPPPMVRGLAAEYISGIVCAAERTIVHAATPRRLLNSTSERLPLTAAAVAGRPRRSEAP